MSAGARQQSPARGRRGATEPDRWRWGFAVAAVGCLAIYAVNDFLWDVRPGSTLGVSYGIAAAVLLALAALYGVRRRAMATVSKLGLGRASTWLHLHLYGSGLFLILVLMHTGFRLPSGALMWALWILSLWTVATGVAGRLLQRWVPKALAAGLSVEANYERIPELVAEIRTRAEQLAEGCDRSARALYERRIAPALAAPERNPSYFLDITGGARSRLKELDHLIGLLPQEDKGRLAEIARLFQTKIELDAHYTLQSALRGWLVLHLPASVVLVVLVALHIFLIWYY